MSQLNFVFKVIRSCQNESQLENCLTWGKNVISFLKVGFASRYALDGVLENEIHDMRVYLKKRQKICA
jgi:hypothetical protein